MMAPRLTRRNMLYFKLMKKQIAILGSTGSIGTQALQVIEEHPDLYEVYALQRTIKWICWPNRLVSSNRKWWL